MYLIYRFFNSVIFMLINLVITAYTCKRFFTVMRSHYKLLEELVQFNSVVRQSRESLDYINTQVVESMKEVEDDIGRELCMTHNLTKISSNLKLILRRFNVLEEGVLELVRMDQNTESVKVQSPKDINDEIKKTLVAVRNKEHQKMSEDRKTPKGIKTSKIMSNESSNAD